MRILSIETSCDETAFAILDCTGTLSAPQFRVLKHLVASQIETHRPFGGVVPNIAKREHMKNLPILLDKLALKSADWKKIDAIAVTVGPGLEPALWAGIVFAKELAKTHKKPLLGAHHMEGHLYSFLLEKALKTADKNKIKGIFPAIGLVVSGGHTILLHLKDLKTRTRLGETRDDAVGEAYDKVARLLSLPYPGGPEIEKIASSIPTSLHIPKSPQAASAPSIVFPRPMIHDKNYDFSFSGLKTAVLYYLRDNPDALATDAGKAKVARAFQDAAVDVLARKTFKAAEKYGAKSILLSGGVSANKFLRGELAREAKKRKMQFHVADFVYNTDNAAMIAVAAYLNTLKKKKYPLKAKGDLGM